MFFSFSFRFNLPFELQFLMFQYVLLPLSYCCLSCFTFEWCRCEWIVATIFLVRNLCRWHYSMWTMSPFFLYTCDKLCSLHIIKCHLDFRYTHRPIHVSFSIVFSLFTRVWKMCWTRKHNSLNKSILWMRTLNSVWGMYFTLWPYHS